MTEFVAAFAYGIHRLSGTLDGDRAGRGAHAADPGSRQGPVTAEPLYVLLSLAGHPDAHEQARVLARQARVQKITLSQAIRADQSLAPYLAKLTPQQRSVLDDPAQYLGAARQRTLAICDMWESRLREIN